MNWKKILCMVLVPALLMFGPGPLPVQAAEDDSQVPETVLVGFFVVIIGVLVILGIRSDREWNKADDSELLYVEADTGSLHVRPDGLAVTF